MVLIILMLPAAMLLGQQKQEVDRRAWYIEWFGNSISALSFNYDRTIYGSWTGRTGIGFSYDYRRDPFLSLIHDKEVKRRNFSVSLPLTAGYLIGKEKKFLELGGGAAFILLSEKTDISAATYRLIIVPSLAVGYRRQPPEGGFLFRVVAGPLYYRIDGKGYIFPLVGLSFGKAF